MNQEQRKFTNLEARLFTIRHQVTYMNETGEDQFDFVKQVADVIRTILLGGLPNRYINVTYSESYGRGKHICNITVSLKPLFNHSYQSEPHLIYQFSITSDGASQDYAHLKATRYFFHERNGDAAENSNYTFYLPNIITFDDGTDDTTGIFISNEELKEIVQQTEIFKDLTKDIFNIVEYLSTY